MTLEAHIREFIGSQRSHGPLTGDATEPTPNGYIVSVSCSCGVVFMRGVTPDEAVDDGSGGMRKLKRSNPLT